jgi:RHS repeat-associated protein
MRNARLYWLSVALAVIVATHAYAGKDAVLSRGFRADQVYSFNDVDSVNALNGNLTVSVPLGTEYRTNGTLKYRFHAAYNSSIWNYRGYYDSGSSGYGFVGYDVAGYEDLRDFRRQDYEIAEMSGSESYPVPHMNAGAGWMVTLGELVIANGTGNATYVDPDGSEYAFVGPSLHGSGSEPSSGASYTRDSNYLRLRSFVASGQTFAEIDFPDGTRKRFACIETDCTSTSTRPRSRWGLDQWTDPFGNIVYVTRTKDGLRQDTRPPIGSEWKWTFVEATTGSEGHADRSSAPAEVRSHVITFRVMSDLHLRVESVELASSGGRARYGFTYDQRRIYRETGHWWGPDHAAVSGQLIYQLSCLNGICLVPVSVLTSIDLPTGERWRFDYLSGEESGGGRDLVPWLNDQKVGTAHYSGRLRKLTLPTGGAIVYTYRRVNFPYKDCSGAYYPGRPGPAQNREDHQVTGVATRQLYASSTESNPVGKPWQYFSVQLRANLPVVFGQTRCNNPHTMMSVALDPFDTATISYFSMYRTGGDVPADSAGWSEAEHSSPFTRMKDDGGGRFLSQSTYRCDRNSDAFRGELGSSGPLNPFDPDVACAGPALGLLRETYVRYESSGSVCPGTFCVGGNRRLASARTIYKDDTGRAVTAAGSEEPWTSVVHSEFDGLGHYRTVTTDSNFFNVSFRSQGSNVVAAGNRRTSRTGYNQNPGSVVTWAPGQAMPTNAPAVGAPWVLGTYTFTSVSEDTAPGTVATPGGIAYAQFDFDPTNGRLRRTRTLKRGDGKVDRTDLLVTIERRPAGQDVITTENFHGGDGQGGVPGHLVDASTVPLGALAIGGLTPEYRIAITRRNGETVGVDYVDCNGAVVLTTARAVVDASSGLVTRVADTAGAALGCTSTACSGYMRYEYDIAGRVTLMAAPGEAPLSIFYSAASATSAAFVEVTRDSEKSRVYYDPFGRVEREAALRPRSEIGGAEYWTVKKKTYHPTGWLHTESTEQRATSDFQPLGLVHHSRYTYDPFGRPVEVLHADRSDPDGTGSERKTTFTYLGVRETVQKIHGIEGPASVADKTLTYDAQGRLVRVVEPSAGPGSNTRTYYRYDVAGRMHVISAGDPGDSDRQVREYSHDHRGFLTSARVPELAGRMLNYTYDSRGNRLTVNNRLSASDSVATAFDLTMRYDVERLIEVKRTLDGRVLKTFSYYPNNAAAMRAGRPDTARRANYVLDPLELAKTTPQRKEMRVDVETTYDYHPVTGKVATIVRKGGGLSMTLGYEYDARGEVAAISYPNCAAGSLGCAIADLAARNVAREYSRGRLRSVREGALVYADPILYAPSGIISMVAHGNGIKDFVTPDKSGLPRPARVWTEGMRSGGDLNLGTYAYDGAGNVRSIDGKFFRYDGVHRLTESNLGGVREMFTYDRHGNRLTPSVAAIDSTTNRIRPESAAYDIAGNQVQWKGPTFAYDYEFDALNMMTHARGADLGRVYVYDADDERAAVYDYRHAEGNVQTWSFRGADRQILREIRKSNGWKWLRDYVYRDSDPLAVISRNSAGSVEIYHLHLDHLGSVRRVTNSGAAVVGGQDYAAFGRELGDPDSQPAHLKFTGHERDEDGKPGARGDLDYMHARYYSPATGRFLSLDPVSGVAARPQTWNRYQYVVNNPLAAIDPDGNAEVTIAPPPAGTLARWTDQQMIEENMKNVQRAVAAERGELARSQTQRMSGHLAREMRRLGLTISRLVQADHIRDLQLDGADSPTNGQYLDGSVNMSNGSRTKVALRNVPLGDRITRFNFTALGNRTAGALAGIDLIRMPVLIPAYRNWSKGYQAHYGQAPTGFTFLAWYVGGAPRNFAPPPAWLQPTSGIH